MLEVAEFAGQQVQAASAPKALRSLRTLEQRVSTLNDAVSHYAMEGAAVVIALPREANELLHVLRRLIGSKFEAERSEAGGDRRFKLGRRLTPRRSQRQEQRNQKGG